jgi:hypothetical protein
MNKRRGGGTCFLNIYEHEIEMNKRRWHWVFEAHEHKIKTNRRGGRWLFEAHEHEIRMNT